ncbi:MAG: ABC transporter permease [Microcella sp.]|uniref:ABC transporter permease n=1 Tax=Microcella sp. TaxID=1913979 RepID=UPI00272076A1|nr:ABC transporter permease [Microcella sp.]MDO8337211.1 ABC transporter permease [Microcella sp.]
MSANESPPGAPAPGDGARFNDRVGTVTRDIIGRASANRKTGRMVVALLLAFSIFAIANPRVFLSPLNLQNIGVTAPEIGIIAIAMMLAMLTGGIDLSLVAIANLSAITVVALYSGIAANDPALAESLTLPIIVAGVLVGIGCGMLNGFLVSVVGITPILATLGTMQILNGIAIVTTGGSTLYGAPEGLTAFGRTALGPVPILFVLFIAIAVLMALFLSTTSLGRKIQLEGANPVAARYSGISSRSVLMSTYTLGGALAGIAGVLFLARNPTASADYGASYVLLVIVIAVLGGTNPNGGFASVAGVVLATLTLQIVSSGFTALRLSSYEYAIAQGVILIAVMVLDYVAANRRQRRPAIEAPPDARAASPEPTPATAQRDTEHS